MTGACTVGTGSRSFPRGHLGGWDVRKVPLSAVEVGSDGVTTLDVPGFATVRTHPFTGRPEALGVVGSGYTPLQNAGTCRVLEPVGG